MKTSSGFRHSFVICAAIFLIGAYSFFSVTVLADKAGEAAKKAADAVALAEKLAKECEDLHLKADVAEENAAVAEREAETAEDAAAKAKADAAEAMEKVGAKETPGTALQTRGSEWNRSSDRLCAGSARRVLGTSSQSPGQPGRGTRRPVLMCRSLSWRVQSTR